MRNNSVIIATNACFLADTLREKLRDASFQVFTAATDHELADKIKAVFPRLIFLEHCFHGYGTDVYIQRVVQKNRNIRIAVWAASEVKPLAAARFIAAGAESFFSLRDTNQNIETVFDRIAGGRSYCPADVEAMLNRDSVYPAAGEKLTRREIEIIKLTVSGKSNKEIGGILSLSFHTVRFHKAGIYRKCGGSTPVDILRNGLIRGIISPCDFE
jgi:DNA-binding NarL/FixJ family response regulator